MNFRQKSDYEDFYLISKSDAMEQLNNAEYILALVEKFLEGRLSAE